MKKFLSLVLVVTAIIAIGGERLMKIGNAFSSSVTPRPDAMHYIQVGAKASNNNYSESRTIGESNPHFGFELGQFVVSGYSAIKDDGRGNILILKGENDTISLTYDLRKDINDLRGDGSHQSINADGDGSDQPMGYARPKGGFGRGALVWRFTDSKGKPSDIKSHVDFFSALQSDKANKSIVLNEEGDWNFALDYEVRTPGWFFGAPYHDQYTVRFNIQVRNANCMVFLMDTETGRELRNNDSTVNGFYLDFANSHYLQAEVIRTNAEEDDVRGSSVYSDGGVFTESGIYQITVTNKYTGMSTTKTIYVK